MWSENRTLLKMDMLVHHKGWGAALKTQETFPNDSHGLLLKRKTCGTARGHLLAARMLGMLVPPQLSAGTAEKNSAGGMMLEFEERRRGEQTAKTRTHAARPDTGLVQA